MGGLGCIGLFDNGTYSCLLAVGFFQNRDNETPLSITLFKKALSLIGLDSDTLPPLI
jgi:hypothetical protein